MFGIDIPDHFAEETFTVYDHPTVTIWEKTDEFSTERARAILNPAKAGVAPDIVPSDAATNVLQLRPGDAAAFPTGATFDDQFSDDGLFASVSWVWWLVWLQISAFAVLPWTTLLFKGLPDKGYGLSQSRRLPHRGPWRLAHGLVGHRQLRPRHHLDVVLAVAVPEWRSGVVTAIECRPFSARVARHG